MGQEISTSHFSEADFAAFRDRLHRETALLQTWFEAQSDQPPKSPQFTIGFELEAWLVDRDCNPIPANQSYLDALNDPLVGPELAKFNIELNTTPQFLAGKCLQRVHTEFERTWKHCCQIARQRQTELIAIGILPTVTPAHLTLANMSEMVRYRALNDRVMSCHEGGKINLEIAGADCWQSFHTDLIVEAAATSFQIHLQVPPASAARYFNAACIASAPLVAISANAPYLFGCDLWHETRIPVFEQVMAAPGLAHIADTLEAPASRVNFGHRYVRSSLLECFEENCDRYPVLLPIQLDDDPATFSHLRLHNGTIWRWNRPLIGSDPDGTPHLRIEHRVIPAGPTNADTFANAAFFFGLTHALATAPVPPETLLPYDSVRANFYAAARYGLDAKIVWLAQTPLAMPELLATAISLADRGLQALDIDPGDRQTYLDIIRHRLQSGQTGAMWQRAYVAKHGPDMQALTAAYLARQIEGHPVHTWTV
ncbi:MAG: glutamate--cysteine ligase [Cyanobacteria bacterium P01_D01_bin.123]